MQEDKEYIYRSQALYVYYLGLVLRQKSRQLRVSLHAFSAGVLVSTIFIILFSLIY